MRPVFVFGMGWKREPRPRHLTPNVFIFNLLEFRTAH
jgi:hypothetical protein